MLRAECLETGPRQFVAGLRSVSWKRNGTPSLDTWRSVSTTSAPWRSAVPKRAIVFEFGYEYPPR
jgi:hypothetical protein